MWFKNCFPSNCKYFLKIVLIYILHILITAPGKVSHFSVTQDSNITAKTNVHIEWNPPAPRDLNGVIKKYYIQYWYKKNQKKVKFISLINLLNLFYVS